MVEDKCIGYNLMTFGVINKPSATQPIKCKKSLESLMCFFQES